MTHDDTPDRSGGSDRRQSPERRTTTLDWMAPVSVDGAPPVQRRAGPDRRAPAEVSLSPDAWGTTASRAVVFPGQGAQAVGMGRDLADAFPVARDVFAEVDDVLGQSLFKLMCEGPEDQLVLTENTQPALMAFSVAVMRVLQQEAGIGIDSLGSLVAGHSLGEYSALTAAGAFSLADAARLLRIRGRAMQQAVPVGEGAMAALMGLDLEVAAELAQGATASAGGVCVTANDNAPGQVVISGSRATVERALELAAERGARRSVLLPVSAPFHCPLMEPAAAAMADALANVAIAQPVVPLVANVTAQPVTAPDDIRALLVQQVTGTVRWRECVGFLQGQGVRTVVEAGYGRVLSGIAKRIDKALHTIPAGAPTEVSALVAAL